MTTSDSKSVLLFASKLGYQTRSFDAAARKLGIRLFYVTDRCHELTNPWGDDALAVRFDAPEHAAGRALQEFRKHDFQAILGLGDRPAIAASYTARGLGVLANHPIAVETCHNKLRMREVFRAAGLPTPWFRAVPLAGTGIIITPEASSSRSQRVTSSPVAWRRISSSKPIKLPCLGE